MIDLKPIKVSQQRKNHLIYMLFGLLAFQNESRRGRPQHLVQADYNQLGTSLA